MVKFETDGSCHFITRLLSLPEVVVSLSSIAHAVTTEAELKKQARLEISVQHSSETLGFLHAAVIELHGRFYLLAGPSQVGKSTYSHYLAEVGGGDIIVHDWVAVEREGETFYLSDVNYPDHVRHEERQRLAGVLLLTPEDYYRRDAFAPNSKEYRQLLTAAFDTATPEQMERLLLFWETHREGLPFCYAVPTRQNTRQYVAETIRNLIERSQLPTDQVGIIGVGSIGQELAFQVGQLPSINKVHLYNRTPGTAVGYALDMNQALLDVTEPTFIPHQDPAEIFRRSATVFICFRDEGGTPLTTPHERWAKMPTHARIIQEYARLASQERFQGTLFVLTNPVDLLTYILYYTSQQEAHPLRTYQVYGLGLEIDIARARYFLSEMGLHFTEDEIKAFGNHSDTFVFQTPLSDAENAELAERVKVASQQVRQYIPRTVYGPVTAARRSLEAFLDHSDTSLAVLQRESFVGMPIRFHQGLPMFPDDGSETHYRAILDQNRETTTRF